VDRVEQATRHGWVGEQVCPDGRELPEDPLDFRRAAVNTFGNFRGQCHPPRRPTC
jgi:hypothetical protein